MGDNLPKDLICPISSCMLVEYAFAKLGEDEHKLVFCQFCQFNGVYMRESCAHFNRDCSPLTN